MEHFLPPIEIFQSIKEWGAAQDPSTLTMKEIYPKTPVSTSLPRPPCPPSWYPNEFAGGEVAVVPNGRVWGMNGAIITPDNHLLWDVSFEGVHITPETHSIFQEKALPEVTQVKHAADLTHVYSRNYYHWMYEVIPRIDLFLKSGLPIERFIVNAGDEQPFQQETFRHFGLTDDRIIKTHSEFHLQAEQLAVATQPAFPTKWGHNVLRSVFLKNTPSAPKKRIFITRRWSRRIANEKQVMKLLNTYGFILVDLEFLSVAEQVQLFSSAEVVIAAHGAGLTNLTFCEPGTKVFEIFSPTYIIPHYWAISAIGDLDYDYIIGQVGSHGSQNPNRWKGEDPIYLNISRFKAFLKKLRIQGRSET
ncbi:glycosyltransferase family 61 protein [Neobacillus drentensis]|uniref:glycosyltransferase family 61 protein n=1 Tax=Neobacillus drentensis TaxID=220684 RepID=UPI002FFECE6E